MSRTYLTADLTLYVSPTGSDSNDGLSTSTPLQHIQTAADMMYGNYDFAKKYYGYIQLMDGTYTEQVSVNGQMVGVDAIIFRGNTADYGAVQWQAPAGQACLSVQDSAIASVSALSLSAPSGGTCLYARQNAVIDFLMIRFYGATVHVSATLNSTINAEGYYAVMTGATYHLSATSGGNILLNGFQFSIINAMAFTYFAFASGSGANISFSGSSYTGAAVTGGQALVTLNAVVSKGGSTIPGSGTSVTNGGQLQ